MENIKGTIIKISLIVLTIIICIIVYFIAINVYKNEKIAKNENNNIKNDKIYTLDNYPKVDASLIMQPLANAFMKNLTGIEQINESSLNYSNTHQAYIKLINNDVDLIIASEPSQQELALAREKNVDLEFIPIVKDGFVFYVNSNNSVNDLSIEQIQKIYTGEILNWRDVGGNDENIIAYQNPTNSNSQIGMSSLVMNGLYLAEPPRESLNDGNFQIINLISNYKNEKNAIGYSYYYYANTLFKTIENNTASDVKFLAINGVKPNNETIKNDLYPLRTNYYIVINKENNSNSPARTLANYMLSSRGQSIIENSGYIPVK